MRKIILVLMVLLIALTCGMGLIGCNKENPTEVEEYAFYNDETITSYIVPASVKTIGFSAFDGCTNLKTVTFEEGSQLEQISTNAFKGCKSLESIVIPASLTKLGDSAFEYCRGLKTLVFEEGIKLDRIEPNAFYECTSLTEIILPKSLVSMGQNAFAGCNKLERVSWEEGSGFAYLNGSAFAFCTNLEEVNLPSKIINMSESVFYACKNLTNIEIPNTVKKIGINAFEGCKKLEYSIEGGLKYLGNKDNKFLCLVGVEDKKIKTTAINSNCKVIGDSSLLSATLLEEITIPASVKCIGENAFKECLDMQKIHYLGTIDNWAHIEFTNNAACPFYTGGKLYINNELITQLNFTTATKINNYAFYEYTALSSVSFPVGVESIGSYAFANCTGLEEIFIPNTVTKISQYAFNYCNNLENIYCEIAEKPSGWHAKWCDNLKEDIQIHWNYSGVKD
ncbi:MAG: leucine-rich repeat domain-containing protein [Clostridia bacterium]|nr:leucine-rich repeat domain-containing protein [Clostridia bacterium]